VKYTVSVSVTKLVLTTVVMDRIVVEEVQSFMKEVTVVGVQEGEGDPVSLGEGAEGTESVGANGIDVFVEEESVTPGTENVVWGFNGNTGTP